MKKKKSPRFPDFDLVPHSKRYNSMLLNSTEILGRIKTHERELSTLDRLQGVSGLV